SNGIENMSKSYIETLSLMPFSASRTPRYSSDKNMKELFPSEKDEYDIYIEDNDLNVPTRKLYW
ncbi:hypothetical protein, partial [Candidatus Pelagibacter sp.]|uniref:hypothetical protein n=1 Tax=Candidatus Pelagibacter sp. TaxID=2024849 RepID=UPI003F84C377